MKATAPIPDVNSQTDTSKVPARLNADHYWATLRRLKVQVSELFELCRKLRRDIDATRKKVYREGELSPSESIKESQAVPFNPWETLMREE